jgi:hypothetical protein
LSTSHGSSSTSEKSIGATAPAIPSTTSTWAGPTNSTIEPSGKVRSMIPLMTWNEHVAAPRQSMKKAVPRTVAVAWDVSTVNPPDPNDSTRCHVRPAPIDVRVEETPASSTSSTTSNSVSTSRRVRDPSK